MNFNSVLRLFRRQTIDDRGPLGDFWYRPAVSSRDVTPSSALTLGAYFACLTNISEDMAKLKLRVMRTVSADECERLPNHPLYSILNTSFNPSMTAFSGRQTLTQWAMAWGNGCAEIERNGIGRPVSLWPIHPSRITIKGTPALFYYEVHVDSGIVDLDPHNVFHIVGRLSDDGLSGISIAQAGVDSISRGMAIQDYGVSLLKAGMSERVALKHPMQLDEKSKQNIRNSWVSLCGGREGLERGPAVIDRGMDVVRVGIPPKDAQLLEEARFTPEDVARWFRCPPDKIGSRNQAQGWSTLEALDTNYVRDTLQPWDVKWLQEAQRKLFLPKESDCYVGHDFNDLLKSDAAARGVWYNLMLRLGIFSRNDIRRLEDMNSIPGGDVYYIDSANLREIKTGSADDDEKTQFERDVIKAFIANGTATSIIANQTDMKELISSAGLPVEESYTDPWLPIVGDNGQPVTGEVQTDSEGDIIGGKTEKPPAPLVASPVAKKPNPQMAAMQEANDRNFELLRQVFATSNESIISALATTEKALRENAELKAQLSMKVSNDATAAKEENPPQEETTTSNAVDGEAENSVTVNDNHLASIRTAAEGALNHAFQRIARKEAKALKKAIRDHLDTGDREGFRTWTTGFYGDMIQELRSELAPHNAVVETITGNGVEFGERCRIHAEGSRTALLAALDEGGTKSVRNRAIEWEKERVFSGVTHGN